MKKLIIIVGSGVICAVLLFAFVDASVVTINAGEVGVLLTFGQASPQPLNPGLHLINPFTQSVVRINVQTQLASQDAAAASSDLQDVSTTVAINYHVNPQDAVTLYVHLGPTYADKVISPAVQETIKQVAAHYSAAELITKRPAAKNEATVLITARLANYNIVVDAISITNFSFSQVFTQAIENKVTAVQQAQQAENQLLTIRIQAQQAVATANGTANSIKLIENQLERSPNYLKYYALQRWNGILPTVTGGAGIPLIDIRNVTK
jgi:regulator of protease activity HflC (stomatin/prohibitin superfamily)